MHVIARENKVHSAQGRATSMTISTLIIQGNPRKTARKKLGALRQSGGTPGPLLGALMGLSSLRTLPRKLLGVPGNHWVCPGVKVVEVKSSL